MKRRTYIPSHARWAPKSCVVVVALLLVLLSHLRCAEAQEFDVLLVRAANGEEKYSRMIGNVVDLTSEHAMFITKGGTREQKITLTRIAEFAPDRSDDEISGRQRLATGEYDSAKAALEKAKSAAKATWQKNEIEALIAQCELGLGEIDAAASRMAALVKDDPDSRLLGYLPLAWVDSFQTPSPANLASWAKDESPVLKLLAASWMLSGDKRKEAAAQLEKISSGPSRRLAILAEAQLWRSKLPTARQLDGQRWLERTASFPEDLQAGPYYIAGQAAARTDQPLRAAEAWMRIALMHPYQASLVAESQWQSAKQLERAGATADALSLYEKIASLPESYPKHAEALEALARLKGTK
jgi:hypothetical protein